MIETHPLGNFIPKNIKYLLLGSFTARGMDNDPAYDWYYGSKRNQLWRIIEQVYNVELLNKKSKIDLFTKLGIGVADIIYQCERRDDNSLDANLINIVYNPKLENILNANKIQKIFFSSRYVEKLFKKYFKSLVLKHTEIELITLPSPSPRYALMTKEEKIKKYREVLPQL